MSVIEYKKGEHKSGFVSFRVDTTINQERYQKYFSLNDYTRTEAQDLANKLNEKWRKSAEDNTKHMRIYGYLKPYQMAKGLTASIKRETKHSIHETKVTYIPCFMVSMNGNNKDFRIHYEGYREAYRKAVDTFCEYHGYKDKDRRELIKRLPDFCLFTDYLYNLAKKKYPDVQLRDIKERIGI